MSLYVYAIVDRACEPPAEWRGLEGGQLSTVGHRSIAAIVSTIAAPPRRDTAALVRHEALVEALGVHHRTLPVRFGTVFSDAGAVTEALSERYESLAGDLARIGDKVELGLSALWRARREDVQVADPEEPASHAPQGGAGARYLQARRGAYARADAGKAAARQLASDIDLAVRDYTFDRRLTVVNEGGLVVRAAYLVAPSDMAAVRAAVDELRGRRPDVAIVLSGPWPPYSFVSGRPGMDVEPIARVPHAP
ncbi:MAG: GvpL/GvpF family gas vesicle protein [Kofleriaceae bacterium]